ncbi:MAG: tetraacyldisaccharide 4'-kinase [Desulforhopalus sp.]
MSKALNLFFSLGRPFSPFYSMLMATRQKLYRQGILRQQSLAVPVISIGNLVLGGTGKTPTVQHVARLLSTHGYRPAVVSRGYRGKANDSINIVSDRQNVFLSPELAGDEPHMLAISLPGVPVLTGTRRFFPCRHAIDNFNTNVLILDDGFQHLSVKRDIDIVLFDATALAGNSRVFPGGHLREPASALNRCHAFLLTGRNDNNRERTEKFSSLLQQRYPDRPVFTSTLAAHRLLGPDDIELAESPSEVYFGFCGIANPSRFENSLESLGIKLAGYQPLNDHTPYSQSLVSDLCKKAAHCGAGRLVTTEKDSVKLRKFSVELPLDVLHVEHRIEQAFDLFLLGALKNLLK